MKKIKVYLITVLSVLLLGVQTLSVSAKTESITPASNYRFNSKESTYVIDKQSKYYKTVWKKAISAWNKVGFSWKKSSSSKIHLMSLTMKQDKRKVDNKSDRMTKNIAGTCIIWSYKGTDIIAKADVKLNKDTLKKNHYTQKERINVAEHELGHALGLNHNLKNSKSVMNPANRYYSIKKPDIKGMNKIYSKVVNNDMIDKKPKLVKTVFRLKIDSQHKNRAS